MHSAPYYPMIFDSKRYSNIDVDKKNLANVIQVYYPLISNNNKITKFYQWSIPHFKQMKRCICGKKAFKLYHELQPNELVEAIQSLSVALPYTLVYLFEMATLREIFATHPKKSLFKISLTELKMMRTSSTVQEWTLDRWNVYYLAVLVFQPRRDTEFF